MLTLLRKGNATRPLVWSLEWGKKRYVVKDYSFHKGWFRELIGRFLIYREVKALRRLQGIEGVPKFVCWLSPYRIVTEEIDGITLEEYEKKKNLGLDFFEALRDLLEKIHSRGVVHCDLKRAANILVTRHGMPAVLDFSSAIFETEFPLFLRPIYLRFREDDEAAIVKYKLRAHPEAVTAQEKVRYLKKGRLELLVRRVRDCFRVILKEMAARGSMHKRRIL